MKKKSEIYRNEIKSYIVRAGMTMSEVVDYLADEHGWSSSVPNLSGKLKRGSLRYGEAVELADALGDADRAEPARRFLRHERQQGADQAREVRTVSGSGHCRVKKYGELPFSHDTTIRRAKFVI